MKSSIKLFTAAAALLLLVGPAFAFESEFHGYYQGQFIVSNFNGSQATTDPGDGFFHPEGKDAADTANLVTQRARLKYVAKANDNLKLVTQFEVDYTFWGNSSYGVGRNGGGAIGADQVNVETKHVYLDLNVPDTTLNVKVGMQPYSDAFEGVLVAADAAGVVCAMPVGGASVSLGAFRLIDDANEVPGEKTQDLVALDTSFALNEATKVGLSYYLFMDDRSDDDLTLHVLGVNGATNLGAVALNGFAVYEIGSWGDYDISAFAAKLGASAKLGPGTLRAGAVYSSGDDEDDDEVSAFQTVPGESGYYSKLAILGRDEWAMTIDNAIVYDLNNLGQGATVVNVGYDMPLSAKANLSANAGMAWVNVDTDREGEFLGTELNVGVDYTVMEGLTAFVRAAYVMLGDYFEGTAADGDDPDNPFEVTALLSYSF